MNNKKMSMMPSIFVLLLTACVVTNAQSSGGGRLAGTWDAAVRITSCSTGDTITTFSSTAAFNPGGTYVGITGGMSPAERTSEVGVWKHLGDNRYQFRFKTYHAPGGGVPTLYDVVTHEIELDADNLNYKSAGTAARYNLLTGIQIFSGCSAAVGTRMSLD